MIIGFGLGMLFLVLVIAVVEFVCKVLLDITRLEKRVSQIEMDWHLEKDQQQSMARFQQK